MRREKGAVEKMEYQIQSLIFNNIYSIFTLSGIFNEYGLFY